MSNPITIRSNTLEQWRLNLNIIGNNVGDPASIYTTDGLDNYVHATSDILIGAINNLASRKVNRSGDTMVDLAISNTLGVTGTSTLGVTTVTTPAANNNSTRAASTAYYFGQASTTTPVVNGGVGSIGVSGYWARDDHSHPGDPLLATNANPSFIGTVAFSTAGSIAISDLQVTTATTTSTSANQVLGSFAIATYRSAEFIIQAVDATGLKYHSATVKVIHDGTTVSAVEYAATTTANGVCGVFSADISGGNLRLLVQPSSTNSTVFKTTAILTKV
jgi:hypothetical protein